MNTIIYKIRKKLFSYYQWWYYTIHGLYFDYVLKTYRTNGLSFVVPRELTNRISRGYFAVGDIETDEQYLVRKYVAPQATVLELGANLGVVSSAINRLLIHPENQVVVEANPTIIPYLEENKQHNRCSFIIENCIVSKQKETAFFFGTSISSGGIVDKNSAGTQESVMVPGIAFPGLQAKHQLTFDTLVMDIEGAEYELLREISDHLKQFRLIIFEQHPTILSNSQLKEINTLLEQNGLSLVDESGDTVVWKRMTETNGLPN